MKHNNELARDRQIRFFVIVLLILGIACISVGYSVYSTNLEINSLTYLTGTTWQIGFGNLKEVELYGTAKEVNPPIMTGSVFNINIALNNDKDSATYYFDTINTGSFDAKLANLPMISGIPDSMKDYIEVTIVHADDEPFVLNEELPSKSNVSNKLTIKYNKENIDKLINDQEVNISIILMYIQK